MAIKFGQTPRCHAVHNGRHLPCVDVSGASKSFLPSNPLAAQVREACLDTGFLLVEGHGCKESCLREAMAAGAAFFDLPAEAKSRCVVNAMQSGRGYEVSPEHLEYQARTRRVMQHDQTVAALLSAHPEPSTREGLLAERFMCGPAIVPSLDSMEPEMAELAQVFFAPNVWPGEVPQLQSSLEQCYDQMSELANVLLRIFAVSLDLAPNWFEDKTNLHHSNMQISNYSSQVVVPDGGSMRKKAHVDSGTLTILASDDWLPGSRWQGGKGGLQLLRMDGVWQEVVVPQGALVVNLGNLMTRWTNGRWQSTLHRVTNPSAEVAADSRRMSCAFFHKPNHDCMIEVVPTCCDAAHPATFPPTRAADLTRAGILFKYRHLPPDQASAAYHDELAAAWVASIS